MLYRTLTALGICFFLFFFLSCATASKSIEEKLQTTEGEEVKAEEDTHFLRNYFLGLTPERFFLYPELDLQALYEAQAAVLTGELSIEDKIGQLFIISLWNTPQNTFSIQVSKWEEQQIVYIRPGGVLLFGGNIDTEKQVKKLCADLQSISSIPLFIATDQEGGHIDRLRQSGKIPATRFPAPYEIGLSGNTDFAYLTGWVTAREISHLGINVDFAPVADISHKTTHPIIGSRSFGNDPALVGTMSLAFARGMEAGGVLPVFKHFPGHGGATTDPHHGTAIDTRSYRDLVRSDLIPFMMGIQQGIDCVMTSHVVMPNVTGDDMPASCSSYINRELLRDKLGYRGIIITDSLSMGAITSTWEPGKAVLCVVKGGADCLLEPPAPRAAYDTLLEAVKQGVIPEHRIDESVRRIVTVKLKAGIIPWREAWGFNPRLFFGEKEVKQKERIIEGYFPMWDQMESGGIGNELHRKIQKLVASEGDDQN